MTTIIEWFKALQGIDWVLMAVAIGLIFGVYIYLLVKVPRLPYVGGFIGKWKIRILGSLFGFLVVLYISCNLQEILANEWVEISLLAGLVAATGALAVYAAGQAYASIKMAEEMKQQRYDAVRPIVDIVIKEQSITAQESTSQAYGVKPKDLPCQLRNVGVGPAIRVHSFIEDIDDPDGNPRRWDFGILPVAMEYTQEMRLLLMQRDNQRTLVAYYEDIYGNTFESIREVNLDEVVRSRGPTKIRKITEEE